MNRVAWPQSVLQLPAIRPETGFLAGLCTLDMVSSAILFAAGVAVEANPLLRPAAEAGALPFVLAKAATYLVPIAGLEYLRHYRPLFTIWLLRAACLLYPVLYMCGVAALVKA